MGIFQGPPRRTKTSKKLKPFHKKKKYQMGRLPTETELGDRNIRKIKGRGNTAKIRLMEGQYVNVSDSKGKTSREKILTIASSCVKRF